MCASGSVGTTKNEKSPQADFPGREVFNHIVSRWGMPLILALSYGPRRFHTLRDQIEGISEKMLSQTLRLLARDGIIARFVEPSIPPRVTYQLTALGFDAAIPLEQMAECLRKHRPDILHAQEQFDAMQ
jgi:DNA-binding HxlR family transcriptional regulator